MTIHTGALFAPDAPAAPGAPPTADPVLAPADTPVLDPKPDPKPAPKDDAKPAPKSFYTSEQFDDVKKRVPEKFHRATAEETIEAFSNNALDLEKQIRGAPKDDEPAPTDDAPTLPIADPDATPSGEAFEDVQGLLKKAGLAGQEAALLKQFSEKGELTAEQYQALGRASVGKKLADRIMAGEVALLNQTIETTRRAIAAGDALVGGEASRSALLDWARTGMDPTRLKTLNEMVKANPHTYPDYIGALKTSHDAAVAANTAPPLVKGDQPAPASGRLDEQGIKTACDRLDVLDRQGQKGSAEYQRLTKQLADAARRR
jgi:hypothetical protein